MSYKFPCGCSFPTNGTRPDGKPAIIFDPYNINMNCKDVWDLMEKGLVKGVFQLESPLGRTFCKKLIPENIEHLSALSSILRPGVLQATQINSADKEVSVTEDFCQRKNNLEEIKYYHISLEDILKESFGHMIYQEQAIKIAQKLASFNESEADSFRKAIGKKDTKIMAKSEKLFLEKAKETGIITDEQASYIFNHMKKSQRYLFNKSHAISYGIIGYITAYCKVHFPVEFFANWLYYAKDKMDAYGETRDLIDEAKKFSIEVCTPDITLKNPGFEIKDEKIYFGLTDIKGVGEKCIEKLCNINLDRNMSWIDFLYISDEIGKSTTEKLISVGAIKLFNKPRNEMLYELEMWSKLNDKEKLKLREYDYKNKSLLEIINEYSKVKKEGGIAHTKPRAEKIKDLAKLLEKPTSPLYDSVEWIAKTEKELLGIPITCLKSDAYNSSMATCTCKEVDHKYCKMMIAVELEEVVEKKIGKGSNAGRYMCVTKVRDSTGTTQVIFFADVYEQVKDELVEGNLLLIEGIRNKSDFGLIGSAAYVIYE